MKTFVTFRKDYTTINGNWINTRAKTDRGIVRAALKSYYNTPAHLCGVIPDSIMMGNKFLQIQGIMTTQK